MDFCFCFILLFVQELCFKGTARCDDILYLVSSLESDIFNLMLLQGCLFVDGLASNQHCHCLSGLTSFIPPY